MSYSERRTMREWGTTGFRAGDYISWATAGGEVATVRITGTGTRYNSEWSTLSADGHSDLWRWAPIDARQATDTEIEEFRRIYRLRTGRDIRHSALPAPTL